MCYSQIACDCFWRGSPGPNLLIFMTLCDLLLSSAGWIMWLAFDEYNTEKLRNLTSMIRSQKLWLSSWCRALPLSLPPLITLPRRLLSLTLSCPLSLPLNPACLLSWTKMPCCEMVYGTDRVAGNWGKPMANSLTDWDIWSTAIRNWMSAIMTWVSYAQILHSQAWEDWNPWRDQNQRT